MKEVHCKIHTEITEINVLDFFVKKRKIFFLYNRDDQLILLREVRVCFYIFSNACRYNLLLPTS